MKFLDDYLFELFGCKVGNTCLSINYPTVLDGNKGNYKFRKGTIEVVLSFDVVSKEVIKLPEVKGLVCFKHGKVEGYYRDDLIYYKFHCLKSEVTDNLVKYSLGEQV